MKDDNSKYTQRLKAIDQSGLEPFDKTVLQVVALTEEYKLTFDKLWKSKI